MLFARCLQGLRYVAGRLVCKAALAAILAGGVAMADPVRLVAIGDSLTHGYGLPQDQGFVPQLQDWLRERGSDVEVINMGVSGDTTSGGRARLGWALADGADAVIVALGGNDMLRGIDPAVSRDNLDAMLVDLKGRDLPVLLAGLSAPLNYGAEFKTAFDGMYSDLPAEHGALLYPSFIAGIDDASLMQPDGIHPNAEGVAVMVERIGPLVQELLEQVPE